MEEGRNSLFFLYVGRDFRLEPNHDEHIPTSIAAIARATAIASQ
jgi:hypothetical protein